MSDIPNYDAHIEGERVFAENLGTPSDTSIRALDDWVNEIRSILLDELTSATWAVKEACASIGTLSPSALVKSIVSDLQSAERALPPRPTDD